MINAEQERIQGAKPIWNLDIEFVFFLVVMQSLYLRERERLHRTWYHPQNEQKLNYICSDNSIILKL